MLDHLEALEAPEEHEDLSDVEALIASLINDDTFRLYPEETTDV